MTKQEAQSWLAETRKSVDSWTVDPIHCSPSDTLIYRGGISGHYINILAVKNRHVLTIGTYTDAIPHIGEAAFTPVGRKFFDDYGSAIMFVNTHISEISSRLEDLLVEISMRKSSAQ